MVKQYFEAWFIFWLKFKKRYLGLYHHVSCEGTTHTWTAVSNSIIFTTLLAINN